MNTTSKHEVRVDVKANDAASKNFSSIAGSAIKLGAAFLGVRQTVGYIRSAYSEFEKTAKATARLGIAIRNIGEESELGRLVGFANKLQDVARISDDTTLDMMRLGASLGLSGDNLRAATIAAIGFHASLDWDLHTSMQNVSKAANGNFRAFKQLGIVTSDVKNETEAFAQVMAKGLDGFRIQRDGVNETISSVESLNLAIDDLKKAFMFNMTAPGSLWHSAGWGTKLIKELTFGIQNLDLVVGQYLGPWTGSGVQGYYDAIQKEWETRRKDFLGEDINPEDIIAKATQQQGPLKKESEFGDMAGDGVRRGGGSGESRFLTMRAGSPIDRTAENTRKMAEFQGLSLRTLNLIYDVLSRGGSVRDVEYGRGYKSYGAATSFS